MSRHRNIRSMNISDEYEGYDDVYGHSVEDDYCISPSDAAQFLYDREGSKGQQKISSFWKADEDIAEEDETVADKPPLDKLDEARLESCIETIKSTLEVNIPKPVLTNIVIKNNFDVERSINEILTKGNNENVAPEKKLVKEKAINKENEIPSIKVIAPGIKTAHVTKGFEVQHKDVLRNLTPRSQSPASRSASPRPLEPLETTAEEVKDLKQKESKVNAAAEYDKIRGGTKTHLYMVVIGHVDAGKSTLMGHLLCALGQVNQRTIHKYEQESRKLGKQSFVYAWVLDETGEERNRGITMDVGKSQFETDTKIISVFEENTDKAIIVPVLM